MQGSLFLIIYLSNAKISTDAEVTGEAVGNLGTAATLTCSHIKHKVAFIKWYKDTQLLTDKTAEELTFASRTFDDTNKYYCEVQFTDFGTHKSAAFDFLVQGLSIKI